MISILERIKKFNEETKIKLLSNVKIALENWCENPCDETAEKIYEAQVKVTTHEFQVQRLLKHFSDIC